MATTTAQEKYAYTVNELLGTNRDTLPSERAATPQGAAGRCSGQQLSSIAALPLLPPQWALDTLVG